MLAATLTVNVNPKGKLADPCVKASPSLSSHTIPCHSMKSDLKADSLSLHSETTNGQGRSEVASIPSIGWVSHAAGDPHSHAHMGSTSGLSGL